MSSAFVANSASHIRPRGRSGAEHVSRHNKENEARTSQVHTHMHTPYTHTPRHTLDDNDDDDGDDEDDQMGVCV